MHVSIKKTDYSLLQKGAKRTRKTVTSETKVLVIRKMEAGEKRANVCSSLSLAPATIMANTEKIKVFLTKFNKKKVEMKHSLVAKDGLQRFKQRLQIHCIKISGEAASANIEATCAFTTEFKKIEDNDFPPDLVFNSQSNERHSK